MITWINRYQGAQGNWIGWPRIVSCSIHWCGTRFLNWTNQLTILITYAWYNICMVKKKWIVAKLIFVSAAIKATNFLMSLSINPSCGNIQWGFVPFDSSTCKWTIKWTLVLGCVVSAFKIKESFQNLFRIFSSCFIKRFHKHLKVETPERFMLELQI